MITIGQYEIVKPVIEIMYDLRRSLHNGKLEQIIDRGNDIQCTCPIHSCGHERKPSCFVRKSDGVFHCFVDNESGGFPKFVSECFDCTTEKAERWIIENCGYEYKESNLDLEPISLNKQENKECLDESILDEFETYHPYMTQRHLSEDTILNFGLRYDPKTKCIVFPVRDINGNLSFLTRRSVESKKFIIDKGADKSIIYLLDFAKRHKRVAIVESQFNALSCWQYGLPAVALMGAGTTDEQLNVLSKTDIREFVLIYDNDPAGRKGAEKFKKRISKDKFVIDIIPPLGKDVNDLTKEEFDNLLRSNGIYEEDSSSK